MRVNGDESTQPKQDRIEGVPNRILTLADMALAQAALVS